MFRYTRTKSHWLPTIFSPQLHVLTTFVIFITRKKHLFGGLSVWRFSSCVVYCLSCTRLQSNESTDWRKKKTTIFNSVISLKTEHSKELVKAQLQIKYQEKECIMLNQLKQLMELNGRTNVCSSIYNLQRPWMRSPMKNKWLKMCKQSCWISEVVAGEMVAPKREREHASTLPKTQLVISNSTTINHKSSHIDCWICIYVET